MNCSHSFCFEKSTISSSANNTLKQIKKLHSKKYRDQSRTYLVDGIHMVEEALRHNATIVMLLIDETFPESILDNIHILAKGQSAQKIPLIILPSKLFASISQTASPQGILAVIEQPEWDNLKLPRFVAGLKNSERPLPHLLLLDNVQDPGNVGTMIRTAEAAGFAAVILGKGCADLYNDKTIRATQGAIFQLPIISANLQEFLILIADEGYESWATTLEEASFYKELPQPQKCAILMGNEGQGLDLTLQKMATKRVKIPMLGQSESLNVGVAAGILIYHLVD